MKNHFPEKFVVRTSQILPKEELEDFFSASIRKLPRTFWTTSFFKKPEKWRVRPVSEIQNAFFLEEPSEIIWAQDLSYFCGRAYVSSLSSLLPPFVLGVSGNHSVLDLCASPGTKTTFLSHLMERNGRIIANEIDASRVPALQDNIFRMGAWNTVLTLLDGRNFSRYFGEEFDKILLDAPCSSEGQGRRDPSFFQRHWRERSIFEHAKLQKELIETAFSLLVEGGELVYSTCTSAPEENEFVIEYLLKKFPEAEIVPIDLGKIPFRRGVKSFFEQKISSIVSDSVCRIFPHLISEDWDSEIFFIAKIRKKKFLRRSFSRPEVPFHFQPLKKNQIAERLKKIEKNFGVSRNIFDGFFFYERNAGLWGGSEDLFSFLRKIPFRTAGIPFFSNVRGFSHEFALHFGKFATKNVLDLPYEKALRFLQGYDLEASGFEEGSFVIVRFEDFSLGVGKVFCGRIKNKLPTNKAWR